MMIMKCQGVCHPVGVALYPHPGRGQQDRDQECAAAQPPGQVLPDEDDDAQVGTDNISISDLFVLNLPLLSFQISE